ncbi:MAG: hypothetical protein AABZ31_12065, partial [Bdellovibrionota bacterium]
MLKSLFLVAALSLGFQANAELTSVQLDAVQSIAQAIEVAGPDWKVGDTADYTMSGSIINGTMHMSVREKVAQGTWIVQDADLGMLGKQQVEILYS